MSEICGVQSPLNYDHTRWATCKREPGHNGDHRDGDLMWGAGFMPSRVTAEPLDVPGQEPVEDLGTLQPRITREEIGEFPIQEQAPKAKNDSKGKRRQRKRQKERQTRRIAELQFQLKRTLRVAASALERCEVADDPSGAADEAAALLRQVTTLDGQYVCERVGCERPHNPACVQTGTTPGGTWEYTCGHLIGK